MQNIEIEFKNLLTKTEYEELYATLPYEQRTVIQTNYYFDTKDRKLQQLKCALRIREKNNQYTLTLKEPHAKGALETSETIDPAIKQAWLNNSLVRAPHIFERLALKNIELEHLHYFGSLQTKRTLFYVNNIISIALDHSFYHGQEDYEIEVETTEERKGKQFFHTLLKDYYIQRRQTKPKIKRFFSHI